MKNKSYLAVILVLIFLVSVSPILEGKAYCEYLGTYSFSTVPKTDYKFQ